MKIAYKTQATLLIKTKTIERSLVTFNHYGVFISCLDSNREILTTFNICELLAAQVTNKR